MAQIEGFRIKNFKVLQDIELGRLWNPMTEEYTNTQQLTPLTVVIGKNGVGKSTLFDAFGFLADCLKIGVEEACDKRGGYDKLISKKKRSPITFEICYRDGKRAKPVQYQLLISKGKHNRPLITKESLWEELFVKTENPSETYHLFFPFMYLEEGEGVVWRGYSKGESLPKNIDNIPIDDLNKFWEGKKLKGDMSPVELADNQKLGVATLGELKDHPRIVKFRRFLESWYLSYFTPDAARRLPLAGPQQQLNVRGDNLSNVVQYMEREHKDRFQSVLKNIAAKIPGIDKITTKRTDDGRLLLCFNDKGFKDPFYAQQMSGGTLKLFAYLIMLENPNPPPFLCIEEPENGLYHKLLEILADEFRAHATGKKGGSQLFITTHQPYLVNALTPEEVWILEKQKDGFSTIRRASDDPLVINLVKEGLPLGGLWYSDYLDGKNIGAE